MDIGNQTIGPMSAKEWMQFFSSHSYSADDIGKLFHRIVSEGLFCDEEDLPVLTEHVLSLGMDPNQQMAEEKHDPGEADY